MATHVYEIGPCCEGSKCLHPNGELRPSHKCPVCGEIAHVNCCVLCPETDAVTCNSCYEKSNCITTSVVPVSGQEGGKESAHDAVNNILNTMEVSVTLMNEEFTTITDSAKTCEYKIIPKDYFILKS